MKPYTRSTLSLTTAALANLLERLAYAQRRDVSSRTPELAKAMKMLKRSIKVICGIKGKSA